MRQKLTAAALVLLLAACDRGLVDPATAPDPQDPATAGQAEKDLQALPLFDLDLRVAGNASPGTPVNIEVRVKAALPASDTKITVNLPELAAMETSGRGREFRVPRAMSAAVSVAPGRPAASWTPSLAARQEQVYRTSVVFPEPGYYQVHVAATGTPDEGSPRDIQNVSHRHVWVLVDERGGRITDSFDPTLLPAGAVRAPGPVRFRSGAPLGRLEAGGKGGASRGIAANSSSCMVNGIFYCDAYLYVFYYDQDASVYRPVVGATVTTTYNDRDQYTGDPIFVDERMQVTDSLGRYHVDCTLYSYYTDQVVLTGYVETANPHVAVYQGNASSPYGITFNHGRVYDVCEYAAHGYENTWDLFLNRDMARVYDNLVYSVNNSRSLMGYTRGYIGARVYTTGTGAWYESTPDRIKMQYNTIWGNYGRFVAAHEYGHALHNNALGGIGTNTCPDPHYLDSASNTRCAYTEGFADFHAALTIGMRMTTWASDYSLQSAESSWKNFLGGTATEGRVAAFFLDLADNASTPDNVSGDDDSAAYGAGYVGKGIKDCYITWTEDTTGGNADGIVQGNIQRAYDVLDLVHCFEGQITTNGRQSMNSLDSQGNIITLKPTSATSITNATGWSRSTVQSIWTANF